MMGDRHLLEHREQQAEHALVFRLWVGEAVVRHSFHLFLEGEGWWGGGGKVLICTNTSVTLAYDPLRSVIFGHYLANQGHRRLEARSSRPLAKEPGDRGPAPPGSELQALPRKRTRRDLSWPLRCYSLQRKYIYIYISREDVARVTTLKGGASVTLL